MQGTVLQYSRQTGWGFIRPDDPDLPDFFVCYRFIQAASKFERYVKSGQRVEFTPVDIDTKPQAHDVRVLTPITIVVQRCAPRPDVQAPREWRASPPLRDVLKTGGVK